MPEIQKILYFEQRNKLKQQMEKRVTIKDEGKRTKEAVKRVVLEKIEESKKGIQNQLTEKIHELS